MKVKDVLKLIDIDLSKENKSPLGNELFAELSKANHKIDFDKDVTQLTVEDYHMIAWVYIPKTQNKKNKKYGYCDSVNEMKQILLSKIEEYKLKV
ncbi:MAG: hypothetical protein WCJ61_05745 [Paludibacter sp.]